MENVRFPRFHEVKSRRRLVKVSGGSEGGEQQERATLGFPRRVRENLVGVSSSPPRIFLSHSLLDLFNLLFLAAGRNPPFPDKGEPEDGTVRRSQLGHEPRREGREREGISPGEAHVGNRGRCLKLRGSFETSQFHSSKRGRARKFSRPDFSSSLLFFEKSATLFSLSLSPSSLPSQKRSA